MLALTPTVRQLRGAGCKQVSGVLEFTAQTVVPPILPAFFVVPVSESASTNNVNAGARDQAIDDAFSVMVVVDGSRRNQDGVSEELKLQVDLVIDTITGWTHPEASRACDYAGGRLGSAAGTSVVWEVRFRSRHRLRKAS